MKVYVIQSKNGIMMNVDVIIENQMNGIGLKIIICEILARVILRVIRHVKMTNIQILKYVCVQNVYLVNKCQLTHTISRSSLTEVFSEKGVLKICSKFTGEHMLKCDFNKLALPLLSKNVSDSFKVLGDLLVCQQYLSISFCSILLIALHIK